MVFVTLCFLRFLSGRCIVCSCVRWCVPPALRALAAAVAGAFVLAVGAGAQKWQQRLHCGSRSRRTVELALGMPALTTTPTFFSSLSFAGPAGEDLLLQLVLLFRQHRVPAGGDRHRLGAGAAAGFPAAVGCAAAALLLPPPLPLLLSPPPALPLLQCNATHHAAPLQPCPAPLHSSPSPGFHRRTSAGRSALPSPPPAWPWPSSPLWPARPSTPTWLLRRGVVLHCATLCYTVLPARGQSGLGGVRDWRGAGASREWFGMSPTSTSAAWLAGWPPLRSSLPRCSPRLRGLQSVVWPARGTRSHWLSHTRRRRRRRHHYHRPFAPPPPPIRSPLSRVFKVVWAAWKAPTGLFTSDPERTASDGLSEPLLLGNGTANGGGGAAAGNGMFGGGGGDEGSNMGGMRGTVEGGIGRRSQSLQWLNKAAEVRVAGGWRRGRVCGGVIGVRGGGGWGGGSVVAGACGVCVWGEVGRRGRRSDACGWVVAQPAACPALWYTSMHAQPAGSPPPAAAAAGGARRFTVRQVEEVKLVLRLLPIFGATLLYWTIYMQASRGGGTCSAAPFAL